MPKQPDLIPNSETIPGANPERRLKELWAQDQFVHTMRVLANGVYEVQWMATARFRSPGSGRPDPVRAAPAHSVDKTAAQGSLGL